MLVLNEEIILILANKLFLYWLVLQNFLLFRGFVMIITYYVLLRIMTFGRVMKFESLRSCAAVLT